MEFDKGGVWRVGGTEVGGALRNAWKVSANSERLCTDNPLDHNTPPSPLNELNVM